MPARQVDGEALRTARRAADVTGQQLGEAVGVDKVQVSNWEREKSSPPPEKLPAIARRLGRPLDELFPRRGARDLADLRTDAGFTQAGAGALIGTSAIPVNKAEKGRQRLVSAYVPTLAAGYGVSEEAILAAQDRSFGVVVPAAPPKAPAVPRELHEKIDYLLQHRHAPAEVPDDAQIAAAVNAVARRDLVTADQFADLRGGRRQLAEVLDCSADASAFLNALGAVLNVPALYFQPGEAVARDVVTGVRLLAERYDLVLAARGGEEAGLSPAMLRRLAEILEAAEGPGDGS